MTEPSFPPSLVPASPGGSRIFCFGLGFSARCLARRLAPRGWGVDGTAQNEAGRDAIRVEGWGGFMFADGLFPEETKAALSRASHVLVSVPPDETGDAVLAAARDDLMRMTKSGTLRWLGYLSTTGVYGDTEGKVVDETAPLNPSNERSRRRVQAEQAWAKMHADFGVPVHVFRLAGIYGPGRSVLDRVQGATARLIELPGHVSSRIHGDDIAQVLLASMADPHPGALYNVADDEAAEQADVVREAYRLLGETPPDPVPFADAEKTMSSMQRSFWTDNRRIDNTKIKNELGVRLLYPTYREGLAAILAAEIK